MGKLLDSKQTGLLLQLIALHIKLGAPGVSDTIYEEEVLVREVKDMNMYFEQDITSMVELSAFPAISAALFGVASGKSEYVEVTVDEHDVIEKLK